MLYHVYNLHLSFGGEGKFKEKRSRGGGQSCRRRFTSGGRLRALPRDRSEGELAGPPDDHEPAAVAPPIAVTPVTDPAASAVPAETSDRRRSPSRREGREMAVESNDDDSRNGYGDRIGFSQSRSRHSQKRSTRAPRGEAGGNSRSKDRKRHRHRSDSDSDSDTETDREYRRSPTRGEREDCRQPESRERHSPQAADRRHAQVAYDMATPFLGDAGSLRDDPRNPQGRQEARGGQQQQQPQRQPIEYQEDLLVGVPTTQVAHVAPSLLRANQEPRVQTVQAINTVGVGSPPGAPPRSGPIEDYGYAQPGSTRQTGPPTQVSSQFRNQYGNFNSPSPSTAPPDLYVDGVKVTPTTPWTARYTVDIVGQGRWDLENTEFGARVHLVSHGVGLRERDYQVEGMVAHTDHLKVYHHANSRLIPARSGVTSSSARDSRDVPLELGKRRAGGGLTYEERPPPVDNMLFVCCPHCRAYGHRGEDCPQQELCVRCGLVGHHPKNCPHAGPGQYKK